MMNRFVFLFLSLGLVSSCKTVTEPAEVIPPHQWHTPTIGSTYLYGGDWVDSTDPADVRRDYVTSTQRIVDTNVSWGGKTGLVAYTVAANTLYYGREPNGDLTVGAAGAGGDTTWTNYPTSSRETITIMDTSVQQQGVLIALKHTTEYLDESVFDFRGRPLTAIHVRERRVESYTGTGLDYVNINTNDYWFAPELGTFVKFSEATVTHYNDEVLSDYRTQYTLELYTRK